MAAAKTDVGSAGAADPTTAPRKSRSGSETRQRTERMTLRLLPQEHQVAQSVADEFGMPSVQALIVDVLQPLMSPGALATLAADRSALKALAAERGLSDAQALILHALGSAPIAAVAS